MLMTSFIQLIEVNHGYRSGGGAYTSNAVAYMNIIFDKFIEHSGYDWDVLIE